MAMSKLNVCNKFSKAAYVSYKSNPLFSIFSV